jgi:hypothetical protein
MYGANATQARKLKSQYQPRWRMPVSDKRIRILTVDDHPLLREGIAALVEGQPDMELVGEAANGLEPSTWRYL